MNKIKYLQKRARKLCKTYESLLRKMDKAEIEYNDFMSEFRDYIPDFDDEEINKANDILDEINEVFGLKLAENKEAL